MAAEALVAYSIGLAGYANIKVLVPAFYALGDARTPALVSCLSIAVNAGFNWLAIRKLGFGHAALALVTSLVALLNFAILLAILERRIGRLERLAETIAKIVVASLGVAAACLLSRVVVAPLLPSDSVAARAIVVAIGVGLSVPLFVFLGRWLGVADEFLAIVRRSSRRGSA
jgi:putative peptidoglycan lipid II flippase